MPWIDGILAKLRHSTSTGLHLREFDSFRGWAVLGVVIAHCGVLIKHLGRGGQQKAVDLMGVMGFAGVDVFFFISGFLLYLAWGKAYAEGRHPPGKGFFYKRRMFRIIPAYYVSLAVILLFCFTVLSPFYKPGNSLKDIIYHVTFIHNIDIDTIHSIDGVYWSLAAEAQFYLILPFLASWFYGRRNIWVAPLFVLFSVSFKFWIYTMFYPDTFVFFRAMQMLPAKLDLFAIGISFANIWIYSEKGVSFCKWLPRRVLDMAIFYCTIIITVLLFSLGFYWRTLPFVFIFWEELFLINVGFMVLASLRGGFGKTLVTNKTIEFLGIISFSVFLWHNFIISLVNMAPFLSGLTGTVKFLSTAMASVVLIMIISLCSYIFVEKPFLSLRVSKKSS